MVLQFFYSWPSTQELHCVLDWWNTCWDFIKTAESNFYHNHGGMETCGLLLGNKDFLACERLANHQWRIGFLFMRICFVCPFLILWRPLYIGVIYDLGIFSLQVTLTNLGLEEHELGSSCQLNRLTQI